MLRSLYDLGLFSSVKRVGERDPVAPRQMMSRLFEEKFASEEPEVTLLRVEAHHDRCGRVFQHGRLHRPGDGA